VELNQAPPTNCSKRLGGEKIEMTNRIPDCLFHYMIGGYRKKKALGYEKRKTRRLPSKDSGEVSLAEKNKCLMKNRK